MTFAVLYFPVSSTPQPHSDLRLHVALAQRKKVISGGAGVSRKKVVAIWTPR